MVRFRLRLIIGQVDTDVGL